MKEKELTQTRLKEILYYDSDTGRFTWRKRVARGVKAGDVAGSYNGEGYRNIKINGKPHLAHRLAWMYIYGYFPEHGIDHINKNPADNRIDNLREASQACNRRNTGNFKNSRSGVKGVMWDKRNNKWQVLIKVNGKQIAMGRFNDFMEAVCHRLAAEECLGWSGCDSNSPAFQYVQQHCCCDRNP